MKLKTSRKLNSLAEELAMDVCIDELLTSHKIPCISLCYTELYDGDDKKAFKFGHEHWGKTVIKIMNGHDFFYYAVASEAKIKAILQKELEEIEALTNAEK